MIRRTRQALARWYWSDRYQEWTLRITPWGRNRANVWPNGVWHTWDRHGSGGENSGEHTVWQAKRAAFDACVRQGFI